MTVRHNPLIKRFKSNNHLKFFLILSMVFLMFSRASCNDQAPPLNNLDDGETSEENPVDVIWTSFGSSQEKGDDYPIPVDWSVSEKPFEILVVSDPISDDLIMPFSDPVPNTIGIDSINLTVVPGEYKAAGFVIRAGDLSLERVQIKPGLIQNVEAGFSIEPDSIDIRGVKCWYQSGVGLRRGENDKKRLTPELLLHDMDLVRVDHNKQINYIKNLYKIQDADSLLPFTIPARSNQQIWLTLHIPDNSKPGKYQGTITTSFSISGKTYSSELKLNVDVKALSPSNIPFEYALFYLNFYDPMCNSPQSRSKNDAQILEEFKDMKHHGLTNVAINHPFKIDHSGNPDFSNLEPVIKLFRQAGFTTHRFIYVDWQMTGWDNPDLYREKIIKLKELVSRYGFDELLVYNKDEQTFENLMKYKETFEIAHQAGAKNVVACDRSTAYNMRGLLDYAILPRSTSLKDFNQNGGNLVLNSDMSIPLGQRGAAWTSSNCKILTINNHRLIKKKGEHVYLAQTLPLKEGLKYSIEYTITTSSNPSSDQYFYLAYGGGSCVIGDVDLPITPGRHKRFFTCNQNRTLRLGSSLKAEFELDDLVVKQEDMPEKQDFPKIVPWAYNDPQAGLELPGIYRSYYGNGLIGDGFEGVCNYAYQSGGCWDDWIDPNWRPHCMTYTTIKAPISTIQWEGLREAINSIKYKNWH